MKDNNNSEGTPYWDESYKAPKDPYWDETIGQYNFDVEKLMDKLEPAIEDRIAFKYYYLPRLLEKYNPHNDEDIERLKIYLIKRNILERENFRYKQQAGLFHEKKIQDWVTKHFTKIHPSFKTFELIGREHKLGKGRIDLLIRDTKIDTIIGIEIKKTATKNNIYQFYRYRDALKNEYGDNSRMLVLTNRYTEPLLEMEIDLLELWRYELKWKYRKNKTKPGVYSVQNIKAIPLTKIID